MFSSNFGLLRRSQRGPALKESWTSMTSSAERSMEIGVLDMAFSPPGFKIGEECLPSQQPIVAGLAGGAQTCFGTASGRIGPSTGWDAAFQPWDASCQAYRAGTKLAAASAKLVTGRCKLAADGNGLASSRTKLARVHGKLGTSRLKLGQAAASL